MGRAIFLHKGIAMLELKTQICKEGPGCELGYRISLCVPEFH